jgi:DNA-binding MarR family transcriptional regulator
MASILHALHEAGECTVNEIVERTQLPNGTLTGLLDALERDGCIERVDNPEDGRSWIVRLTSSGRRLCAKLVQRHREVMAYLRESLSDSEVNDLARLLTKATEHMRRYGNENDSASGTKRKTRRVN